MKSATLTAVANEHKMQVAALLINLESQRQIPTIFQSLAKARSGLWPKYVEGTTIQITSSKGEGELLKLFGSLSDKGYKIEIDDKYENLEAERKARIEAIEARKRQDAIPPMTFANARFSFRSHPHGLRVTFASQTAFLAWATGHEVQVLSVGKHHAYLPKAERSRLSKEGIAFKSWQQPRNSKLPPHSNLLGASCPLPPSTPFACPVDFPVLAPPAPTRPSRNATKAEWGSYALFLGIDEEVLVGLKRDQIIEECDLMEATASI